MNYRTLFLFLCAFGILASCSKENDESNPDEPNSSTKQLTKIIWNEKFDHDSDLYPQRIVSHIEDGRVSVDSTFYEDELNFITKYSFSSENNVSKEEYISPDGAVREIVEYQRDANNRVIYYYYEDFIWPFSQTRTYEYTDDNSVKIYNGDGDLIVTLFYNENDLPYKKVYSDGDEITATYDGNNVSSIVNDLENQTIEFTYGENFEQKNDVTFGQYFLAELNNRSLEVGDGLGSRGSTLYADKLILQKDVIFQNGLVNTINYSYEFDDEGYLVKMTESADENFGDLRMLEYFYE